MVDRVHPLKFESSVSGGTENDEFPTALDPNEDYVDVRGITIQDDESNDEDVYLTRALGSMVLTDKVVGSKTLSQLAAAGSGVSEETHKTLRQLIHFIEEGPADGFATGAFKEAHPIASLFPTSIIWWESSAKLKKIVEKTITRSGGGASNINPTPIVWRMYGADGVTVVATISDVIAYSGVFEVSRTRTIG